MKKKIISVLLALTMIISAGGLFASAYNQDILNGITANYDKALSLAGRSSFYGNCNLATAYQLLAAGIYKDGLDFSGSGIDCLTYFDDAEKTSGGYNVNLFEGADCLYDLIEQEGNEIYNVIYSLGTGGSSGSLHILYIAAIIDGYVYFTDSFNTYYNGTSYSEGQGTVLSVDGFVNAYRRMNGNPYCCVYFSGGNTASSDSSSQDEYSTGDYKTTASMLNLREEASINSTSLGLIPMDTVVTVTEVKNDWGKTSYENIPGWINLKYASLLSVNQASENDLKISFVSANRQTVKPGEAITWSAMAADGNSTKYQYSFTVYRYGTVITISDLSESGIFTFTPEDEGIYTVFVYAVDGDNNIANAYSDEIYCIDADSFIMGDVNGDGKVTSADARITLRVSAGIEDESAVIFVSADVNEDGKITSADARFILRKAAGIENF